MPLEPAERERATREPDSPRGLRSATRIGDRARHRSRRQPAVMPSFDVGKREGKAERSGGAHR